MSVHQGKPVVEPTLDPGVTAVNDLSSCDHTKNMVAKAHMRSNAIHRCFVSMISYYMLTLSMSDRFLNTILLYGRHI